MPVETVGSQTGLATLPDIGSLIYNEVKFSALFHSTASATPVSDEAKRTVKDVEITIEAEGVVTLPDGKNTTDDEMDFLRTKLSQQAGALRYRGKGFGTLSVNWPGGDSWDVAWGPEPQVLHFQPLGASRSANVSFRVVTRISQEKFAEQILGTAYPKTTKIVCQYNYGITLSYDDEGYAGFRAQGTLEIPMTRTSQDARSVQTTVDAFRQRWLDFQVDLTRWRPTRRNFDYSRDRRTCQWEFAAEELPSMGLPPGCTSARGTMSVRDVKLGGKGGGILTGIKWGVSLRATYTVRPDEDRNVAFLAFYALFWFRYQCSRYGKIPKLAGAQNTLQQPILRGPPQGPPAGNVGLAGIPRDTSTIRIWNTLLKNAQQPPASECKAFVTGFSFDEGLYLDSRTISFQASWWVITTFSALLGATGVWRWLDGSAGGTLWAQSVKDIMGWRSWGANALDPKLDVVVDLGFAGTPPLGQGNLP